MQAPVSGDQLATVNIGSNRPLDVETDPRAGKAHEPTTVTTDDETVVVLVTVCQALAGESREEMDIPCNVWLEKPLGERAVIDGTRDAALAEGV